MKEFLDDADSMEKEMDELAICDNPSQDEEQKDQ